eukprot:g39051.t1
MGFNVMEDLQELKNQLISEILMFLRDTIAYLQDKWVDTCLISLNQEKAFDRILHLHAGHFLQNGLWGWDTVYKALDKGEKNVSNVALILMATFNASSPELSNKYQDIAWLVSKELTLTECCRLAHSKVQGYVLSNALKLGAAVAKAQWGEKLLSKVFLLKFNGG